MKDGTGGREDAAPTGPLGDELSLLTKLLTSNDNSSSTAQHIIINLFDDDDEPKKKGSKTNGSASTTVGKVKISKASRPLDSAMKEVGCFSFILFVDSSETLSIIALLKSTKQNIVIFGTITFFSMFIGFQKSFGGRVLAWTNGSLAAN